MLKISFFLLIGICVSTISFSTSSPGVNLCKTLTPPNVLLLDRFQKIKLIKLCRKHDLITSSPPSSENTGCYYRVPDNWADSINYPTLEKTGLMIISSSKRSCPQLSYRDFQQITLKGKKTIEESRWHTFQINPIKRLLRKSQHPLPQHAPLFLSAEKTLKIFVYTFKGMQIPLMDSAL